MPLKYSSVHARAKLIPSAAVLHSATSTVCKDFIRIWGSVLLPTDAPAADTRRDERLGGTVYNCTGAENIRNAAKTISKILFAIAADADGEFIELDEDFAGLPSSLIQRWYLSHGDVQPSLEARALRNHFLDQFRDYVFDDTAPNQIKAIALKCRSDRLARLSEAAAKDRATPSADTIAESDLLAALFPAAFISPDTLMLAVSTYSATNWGIQIDTGSVPKATLAAMLITAGLSYDDTPFSATPTSSRSIDSIRLEVISTIASRWMLRSEPLFYNAVPRIAYPGIPTGASNLGEALTLIQDLDTFTSEFNLLKLALLRVGGYLTPSDDARDLTHRLYYFLRFSGCSTQLIAERIQTATDSITKGEEDSITPQAFCDSFGALAPMAPLTDLPVTDFQVGKAQAGVITPFLAHEVEALAIGGHELAGYTLSNLLLLTNGAPWVHLRLLDKDGNDGFVTGVASRSDEESSIWYKVSQNSDPSNTVEVSAQDVYKNHLAYAAKASKQDFAGPSSAQTLADVLSQTTLINSAAGHHRSNQVLSVSQLNTFGNALGCPVPGAPSSAPAVLNSTQCDNLIAQQISLPVTSRSSSAALLAQNWLTEVSSKLDDSGAVKSVFADKHAASSRTLNMIIERKLAAIKKGKRGAKFYFDHSDLLLFLRGQHGAFDLKRCQVKEKNGPAKPPPFANTQTGLMLFILALTRAKDLEIGASVLHQEGWDNLIQVGQQLMLTGFTRAMPQDYYDYVDAVFTQFTLEHRAAVLDVHDPSDYPTFHHLVDEDELVSYAFSMLQDGNKLRKQVKALVKAETTTHTPTGKNKKKTKKAKQPSPSTTSGSDSSSSPSPDKRNNRQKKSTKRTKRQPTKRSKSTNQDEERAEHLAERDRQRGLPDGHPELDSYQVGLRTWLKSDASMDNSVPPRPRCYRHATSGSCISKFCRRSHEPAG